MWKDQDLEDNKEVEVWKDQDLEDNKDQEDNKEVEGEGEPDLEVWGGGHYGSCPDGMIFNGSTCVPVPKK